MATIAERLVKLGGLIVGFAGWAIANSATTFKQVYDGNQGYKDAVDGDPEIGGWPAGELAEALEYGIPSDYLSINP